jgi:phosphotransferase system enzyme I (PtsI)
MAPACLADVRAALGERTLEECRALARVALDASSAVTARAAVSELVRQGSLPDAAVESQPA